MIFNKSKSLDKDKLILINEYFINNINLKKYKIPSTFNLSNRN